MIVTLSHYAPPVMVATLTGNKNTTNEDEHDADDDDADDGKSTRDDSE